mmetsp:Transcript_8962/g.16681  ORF Transcript_8962/g.16681 Transcript_8962/m.16681 type:complete len:86 (-) Transcript_8962:138-395(-)
MPVTKLSVGLTTAGALCVAACRLAWHKKATTPFRFAYFFSWPTLGTGLILLAQPENNNMVERLYKAGHIDKQKYEELMAKHEKGS